MEDYIKKTIDTYNRTANKYAKNVKDICPINELEKFVKYVVRGNILDIGCGSGIAAKNIQERGLQVTGIDLSKKLIDIAKIESPNSNFYEMDMRKLFFPDELYDGIWQMASLLHLEKKDVPRALSEASRVLKPEGTMYLSLKCGNKEGIELDARYHGLPKQYTYFEPEEINEFLKDASLEVFGNSMNLSKNSYHTDAPKWLNIFARKK